jgi:hypothetical protein
LDASRRIRTRKPSSTVHGRNLIGSISVELRAEPHLYILDAWRYLRRAPIAFPS